MKTCSYCGKQYPDDTAVCPADGQALSGTLAARKKVTGVWRGVFGYGPREARPGFGPVAFTLKLKQGWFSHFEGSVTDDPPQGTPGTGTVDGHFSSPRIEFTKQMPVGYLIREDGSRMTFREYLLSEGQACEHELPAQPLFYQGTLLDGNRMQGVWMFDPNQAPITKKLGGAQGAGFWCAEFVTDDLSATPAGGPTGPLFDKSLLSPRELEAVEGVTYVGLGKFKAADLPAVIDHLVRTEIRFKTARLDEAGPESAMEQVLVHPEDAAEAAALFNPEERA